MNISNFIETDNLTAAEIAELETLFAAICEANELEFQTLKTK